jgi:methionyl aminopeptidase
LSQERVDFCTFDLRETLKTLLGNWQRQIEENVEKMTERKSSDEKTRPSRPKPVEKPVPSAEKAGGPSKAAAEEEAPEEKYRRAGRIAAQIRNEIAPTIKVGVRVFDICEKAEARILELGGRVAFPTNVSINEVAAHYSSPDDDPLVVREGDLVKLDIGVHVDGYIADTAVSVSFNPALERLVEASREALTKGLELVKPKANAKDIGKIIEDTIRGYGYRPIRELSGHQLDQYLLHGAKSLPNIAVPHGATIEEGEAYALETFATTGTGSVHQTGQYFIFSLLPQRVALRSNGARAIVRLVSREFRGLPFSRRYLSKHIQKLSLALGLRELITNGFLRQYSVLADVKGSFVAQTENTFLVTKDGAEIVTK